MKKITILTAGIALAAAASSSSFAQAADSGVYVGVEGAYASVNSVATPSGARKTSETTDVPALRAMIGYQFNKNLALELGYFATDDFKQSGTVPGTSATYDAKADAKGADLAVVYKFTEFVPGLFLKAGATYSKVSASATARVNDAAIASASDSVSGTGYLVGLGYEFTVSQNLGARLGYTRYEKLGGENDNKLNMFSVGLKYQF